MRANELRIGNFVDERVVGYCVVNDISNSYLIVTGIYRKDLMYSVLPENAHPIPLTEEWLLKFGFKAVPFAIPDKFDNRKIQIKRDERGFWVIACYNFILIKHVHQLQNLYFALTGEELTIKKTEL